MTMIRPALLATLGLFALASASTPALARDKEAYLGLRGGLSFPAERRFFANVPLLPDFTTTEKHGWAAAARLGYDFGMLRTEFDVGYHQNNLRTIDLQQTTPLGVAGRYAAPTGRMRHWTVMANALVDVINTDGFSVSVGAGAGAARINAHNVSLSQAAGPLLNESDWVFAWNALAGARLAISQGVDLAVDYRYLRPNRANFDNAGPGFNTRSFSHMALVGLNFNFGGVRQVAAAPEPAPMPVMREAAPAPQPEMAPPPPPPPPFAGPLVLFFDFDQDVVTPEAGQVIARAAEMSRQTGTTILSVTGHTDRSGSQTYNQALGMRRAQAVQRELEALGIESSRISIQSFGEDRSLVDTVDGQREPQNRRVEISIQPR